MYSLWAPRVLPSLSRRAVGGNQYHSAQIYKYMYCKLSRGSGSTVVSLPRYHGCFLIIVSIEPFPIRIGIWFAQFGYYILLKINGNQKEKCSIDVVRYYMLHCRKGSQHHLNERPDFLFHQFTYPFHKGCTKLNRNNNWWSQLSLGVNVMIISPSMFWMGKSM